MPETDEDSSLLVVDGLITDQTGVDTVKLYKSLPLGRNTIANPVKGCTVTITDDFGNVFPLKEISSGTYITDSAEFIGIIGRKYSLNIKANATFLGYSYQSAPVEMKPVPEIDSVYYKKVLIAEGDNIGGCVEGCQIYLDMHDPVNRADYYRWDYIETWKFRIPYQVENRICWRTESSKDIIIKDMSHLSEVMVKTLPVKYINYETDRLRMRYSILVNQYSLNESEYTYWDKIKSLSQNTGSLYDLIPSTIPSNVTCIENPGEVVLGYFSVSAKKSKRLYIDEYFWGQTDVYATCDYDTIYYGESLSQIGTYYIVNDFPDENPPFTVVTTTKMCSDCTTRGSAVKPSFWDEEK